MDFKRINDISEAYRQAAHAKMTEFVSEDDYDVSDCITTPVRPTVNIVDNLGIRENGAWVAVQLWIPQSVVRDLEVWYRIYFHQARTVNIIAKSAEEAQEKFERGEWKNEDSEDDHNYAGQFNAIHAMSK